MSENPRRLWWNTTTDPDGGPLTKDGESQSLKTSSLLGQAYQWTWFKNTSIKNNPQCLGTSSNRGRASDPHKTRSCTHTQIQSRTSSLKTHSQKTPLLYFLRQLICLGNFIKIKQEGSQSLQAGVISISSLLTTLTQTPSCLICIHFPGQINCLKKDKIGVLWLCGLRELVLLWIWVWVHDLVLCGSEDLLRLLEVTKYCGLFFLEVFLD